MKLERDAVVEKRERPLVGSFAVQNASGAELTLRYSEIIEIEGTMPFHGENRVEIAVGGPEALAADIRPLLERRGGPGFQVHRREVRDASQRGSDTDGAVRRPGMIDQWQTDAFGQLGLWLKALGFR